MKRKFSQKEPAPLQQQPNQTGIPSQMKIDFERRSGLSFDDVRIHYNSDMPARVGALAYTRGTQVYIGPGQTRHLRHELGHVIQQKMGIVRPTTWVNGLPVNDSPELERAADRQAASVGNGAASSCRESAAIQRFYVIPAEHISAPPGTPGPIFTTHMIVHDPLNRKEFANRYADLNQAYTDLQSVFQLHQIKMQELQTAGNDAEAIRREEEAFQRNLDGMYGNLVRLSNKYFGAGNPPLTPVGIDTVRLASLMTILNNLESKPSDEEFKKYFQQSGLISEPQLPDRPLGAEPFNRTPRKKQMDPQHIENRLEIERKFNFWGNVKSVTGIKSQIYVLPVISNSIHPMLVSKNGMFALTALYSEPKEVYLSDAAYQQAKTNLEKVKTDSGDGQRSLRLIQTLQNQVLTFTNGTASFPLKRYVLADTNNIPVSKLVSHICDQIKAYYFREIDPDGLRADFGHLKADLQASIPWSFHVAGRLLTDGEDSITFENGARNVWLFHQLIESLDENNTGEKDVDKRIRNMVALTDQYIKDHAGELNSTWYFRMYGPKQLGQDILNQTISRFTPLKK